ncbi:MAG: hypothetical protein U1D97_12425 [Desulfuromonadales bacterium]|nr:hypothetical protein [Desulfuromonadales bacterium]
MYPVQSGDKLYRVTRYDLQRGGFIVMIELRFYLSGPQQGLYVAAPLYKIEDYPVSESLWGKAATEGAALHECLQKIKHLSAQEIYSFPEKYPFA